MTAALWKEGVLASLSILSTYDPSVYRMLTVDPWITEGWCPRATGDLVLHKVIMNKVPNRLANPKFAGTWRGIDEICPETASSAIWRWLWRIPMDSIYAWRYDTPDPWWPRGTSPKLGNVFEAVGLRHLAAIYGWHRPTLRPQVH